MSRAESPLPTTGEHRRRTSRQARHEAKATLHTALADAEVLEDADAYCPRTLHDLGRHASPPPKRPPKPGRRGGFKVWKTTYWKRRTALRSQRNAKIEELTDQYP